MEDFVEKNDLFDAESTLNEQLDVKDG